MHHFLRCLTSQELSKIIDTPAQKVFQYLINKSLKAQCPIHPEDTSPLTLELTYRESEKWFQQALGGKLRGQGNGPVDLDCGSYLIDAKSVTETSRGKTHEVSLLQIFNQKGNNTLDDNFKENKRNQILNLWVGELKGKHPKSKKPHYIIVMIKHTPLNKLSFVGFEVLPEHLEDLKLGIQSKSEKSKSINISGVLDPALGVSKIYISKRRLEVRFNLENLKNNLVSLKIDDSPKMENLRDRFI